MKPHSPKKIAFLAALAALCTPAFSYAAVGAIETTLEQALEVLSQIYPVVISGAVLLFLWGLAQFVLKTDNRDARESARNIMIWGVGIIFVMVSVWGLVNIIGGFFDFEDSVPEEQIDDLI